MSTTRSKKPIADIPVSIIGPWGAPMPVGRGIFEDPHNMRIEFKDPQFVEEFYDLKDQELTITLTFQQYDRTIPQEILCQKPERDPSWS